MEAARSPMRTWTVLAASILVALVGCEDRREQGLEPRDNSPARFDAYTIGRPITHENLTVYMIQGPDVLEGQEFLTLSEALAQEKLVIHETGNVDELAVENLSDKPVFIGSGEILRGGKQDRMCQYDYIVKADSGPVPLSSFCVEAGRWQARAGDDVAKFGQSKNYVVAGALKVAARGDKSQQAVWDEVRRFQDQASESMGKNIRSGRSETSLELALDDKDLQNLRDAYVRTLQAAPGDRQNVVGFAYAINGKLCNVDIYGNAGLFEKLWPKLLAAGAVEAIAKRRDPVQARPPAPHQVALALNRAQSGQAEQTQVAEQVQQLEQAVEDMRMFTSTLNRPRAKACRIRQNLVVTEQQPGRQAPNSAGMGPNAPGLGPNWEDDFLGPPENAPQNEPAPDGQAGQ